MRGRASFYLSLVILMSAAQAAAETVTEVAAMQARVNNVFSIEFYKDANVLHGDEGITFTNIDPTKTFVCPDDRKEGDGRSDTGVVCRTNMNTAWYLKVSAATTSDLSLANFKYYMEQPLDKNTGARTDGKLAQASNWYSMPTSATTVYSSGAWDKNSTPLGTLAAFSFAIDPTGLVSDTVYSLTISYTISTTP